MYDEVLICGLCGTFLYLLYCLYMQDKTTTELNEDISISENRYNKARKELNKSQNVVFEEIQNLYGSSDLEKVKSRTIWVNMSDLLLIVSMGIAREKKQEFYKGNIIEKWYYDGYVNRLGNQKYRFEVTLENDFVVGWRDLK